MTRPPVVDVTPGGLHGSPPPPPPPSDYHDGARHLCTFRGSLLHHLGGSGGSGPRATTPASITGARSVQHRLLHQHHQQHQQHHDHPHAGGQRDVFPAGLCLRHGAGRVPGGLVSLLTVLMNLLVLYAVNGGEKSLHTVGNLYIISLSVADLMVGATVMPLNLTYLLMDEWNLGHTVCQFWLIMDYVASTASIFNLFILCLDRYRSVRQPLKYLKYRTRGRACLMISGAWLLSMTWIIPILGWRWFAHVDLKPEDENKCDTDFRFVTWFKVITAIFNFYMPSFLMLWFYMHIYMAVRQHLRERERIVHPIDSFENEQNALNPEETTSNPANSVTIKQTWQRFIDQSRQRIQSLRIRKEHKAAKQLGFIIAAFMLCWIPYFIAFMVMAFCRECVHHELHMFTIWLGYINSTLNPFIYPLCNGNFKKVFKRILHIPEHL
ncbi:hypothetical protein CRUP_002631 [Coryphaenoides rupestris]|nr:hypothetical protein CRUP_002631 [Coryphaenoides rupestris]